MKTARDYQNVIDTAAIGNTTTVSRDILAVVSAAHYTRGGGPYTLLVALYKQELTFGRHRTILKYTPLLYL